MDWATVRSLADDGIEFGGHSRAHANLTKLSASDREDEIAGCAVDLSEQIGKPVEGFAAPYGCVSPDVVESISRHYRIAFGTRLALPKRGQDRFDIPRIDMHYFRDRGHWAGLLKGHRNYLRLRQMLRAVRSKMVRTPY
jgi:peptidoglycan/xylan/chitin deacetylase (PgdA/CDA1 family)